jgi:hypothetical protein
MKKISVCVIFILFQNFVFGIEEEDFFKYVKEKRNFFKESKVEYKREFIKWEKLEDYFSFKKELEENLNKLNKEKIFNWYLHAKIRENYIDGNSQNIISYYQYTDEYPYIRKMRSIKNLNLSNKENNSDSKIKCRKQEFSWEVGENYKERCIEDKKGNSKIKFENADLKNLVKLGIGLGNFDLSLSPLERIKVIATTFTFTTDKNLVIIKTKDGELYFDSSKSYSAKKLISYSQSSGEIIEEALYGAYEKVGNYYVPFFIIDTKFTKDKIESSVVLVEKYQTKGIEEKDFKID